MAFTSNQPTAILHSLLLATPEPLTLSNGDFESGDVGWNHTGSWFINSGILGFSQIQTGFADQQIAVSGNQRLLVRYNVTTLTVSGPDPINRVQLSSTSGAETDLVTGTSFTSEDGWLETSLIVNTPSPYLQFYAKDLTIGIEEVLLFRQPLTGTRKEWLQVLQDAVGTRIYSNRRPQTETQLPCIVLRHSAGREEAPVGGHLLNVTDAEVEVTIYSTDPTEIHRIYDACKGAYHGYSGTYNGATVQRIHVDIPPIDRAVVPLKGSDQWTYRATFDLSLAYEQTVTSF
jgi:hypothetical protein